MYVARHDGLFPAERIPANGGGGPQIWTVAELTARIKDTLESTFPAVWVAGELSDVARPHSGHIYCTLKDDAAQIRAVIWRSVAARLRFAVEDGLEVICCGDIDVYPPRGSYQLVIRQLEPRGVGTLQLALRQLQARLQAEGLFAAEHKRPLPRFPRRIGVITSPTGAAIRDFLEVLRRRWPAVDVAVLPSRVQGDEAVAELVAALQLAHRLEPPLDVVVITRGGGSLEDLWCFNDERLVRAIHAARIPVVSAVGHEIDITLCDLVADVRALTPSEAAERVVPAADEVRLQLRNHQARLVAALRHQAVALRLRLDALAQRRALRRPFDRLQELARGVDEWDLRLTRALQVSMTRTRERLGSLAAQLESLSPLRVFARGYSLTQRAATSEVVRDAADLSLGELLRTRLGHGETISRVEQIHIASPEADPLAGESVDAPPGI